MNTINFFLSSFIIIVLPGIGVIYTISTGITQGKEPSLHAALGCTLGILPHLFISIMFSSLIQEWNQTVFTAIKWAGILYLLYLGFNMLIHSASLTLTDHISNETDRELSSDTLKKNTPIHIIQQGILINLLNPKLTLFFFSFLPQYAKESKQSYLFQCWILGLLFMLITYLVFAVYGLFAAAIKDKFLQSSKHLTLLQKIFGLIFIAFALKLAIA